MRPTALSHLVILAFACSACEGTLASLGSPDGGSSPTIPTRNDARVAIPTGDAGTITPSPTNPTPTHPTPTAPVPTGWRPFADSSPWNQPIAPGAAVRPDSAALIEGMRQSFPSDPRLGINISPWSVPVYTVGGETPMVTVRAPLSNEGENQTFHWPVPAGAEAAPELDGHLTVLDIANGRAFDMYQGHRAADGTWDCTLCSTVDLRGSGVRPPSGTPPWYSSHGSRACGYPLIAGLIRVDEIRAGQIDHALVIAYPGLRTQYFVTPASIGHPDNGIAVSDRGIPCGGRVQLDPSIDIDSLGLSPAGEIVARALRDYGAFVGDFSGSISLYAEGSNEAQSEWAGMLEPGALRNVPLDALRVVEWGTLSRNP